MSTEGFPRLHEYITGLPSGLESYPECTSLTDGTLGLFDAYRHLFRGDTVPTAMRQLNIAVSESQKFLSTAVINAGICYLRDTAFESDAAMLEHIRIVNVDLFKGPLFRALFFILSPTLVFAGAADRWSKFHTGTTLKNRSAKGQKELVLAYPSGLFQRTNVLAQTAAFRVAVESAGAKDVVIKVKEHTQTQTTYSVSWS